MFEVHKLSVVVFHGICVWMWVCIQSWQWNIPLSDLYQSFFLLGSLLFYVHTVYLLTGSEVTATVFTHT